MKKHSERKHPADPDDQSKFDLMKTQGLFLIVRLFVFIAIMLAALLIIFFFVKNMGTDTIFMFINTVFTGP